MSDSVDDWIFIPAFPKQPHVRGAPLPVPVSQRSTRNSVHGGRPLELGGLPVPAAKSRPRSLSGSLHSRSISEPQTVSEPLQIPDVSCTMSAGVTVGRGRQLMASGSQRSSASALLRIHSPSQSPWIVQTWHSMLKQLGCHS